MKWGFSVVVELDVIDEVVGVHPIVLDPSVSKFLIVLVVLVVVGSGGGSMVGHLFITLGVGHVEHFLGRVVGHVGHAGQGGHGGFVGHVG